MVYGSFYSRAQAIKDGTLVDITAAANKAGFKIPVAVTHLVWEKYIAGSNIEAQTEQELESLLQNILINLRIAIKKAQNAACIFYKSNMFCKLQSKKEKTIQLKAVLDSGDNGEAVFTIMLPHGD